MPLEQPKYKTSDEVDFVIIGSGAAGGILAKELSTNGFRVVVLEQGPYLTEADFTHDEVKVLAEDLLTNHPKLQPTSFRKTPDEKAKPQRALVYGRLVGGTSVHFTANFWRFHEIDFIERSKVGPIAGTGFADWPITYADLEPYYTKVEWEIGVSGLAGASPFDPPRSKPYPMPPLPVKSSGVIFEQAARKLGWHAFPAPMAILSQPRPGRSACTNCGFCLGFGCEVGAKSSSLATAVRMAEKTGRCEIRPNSYVHRIEMDNTGRATGAVYFDEKRNVHLQKAKAVVVCANGAETPRLLLLSANKQFPNGLANSSGLVGKYLMLNSGGPAMGVFEHPLNDYKGFAVSRIFHDFYELDAQKVGFYGGGGLDARFDLTPVGFAMSALPPDAPRWGKGFKDTLRNNFTRTMQHHADFLPRHLAAPRNQQLLTGPGSERCLGPAGAQTDLQGSPRRPQTLELDDRPRSGTSRCRWRTTEMGFSGTGVAVCGSSPGHLPHGQRSENFRDQCRPSHPRREESIPL
jgi:choline dehydrogenase-like flavoprotein